MMRLSTLLLLLLSTTTTAQTSSCSLCLGGAEANLTKTIGGTPTDPSCAALSSNVEIDEDGCRDLQVLGYRWCDCPDYPEDYYCPMCKNAFTNIPNRFKQIPGTGKTCEDQLFVPKSSVGSCLEAMKPGYVCGCPDADEPYCTICGGSVEGDAQITNPEAMLTINGVGSFSCQELVDQAIVGDLSVDQCGLVQAEAFQVCGCQGNTNTATDSLTTQDGTTEVPVETDEVGSDDSAAWSVNVKPQHMASFVLGVALSQLLV